MTTPPRNRRQHWPVLAVVGALLVSGAWLWSTKLEPDARIADGPARVRKAPIAPTKPVAWKKATPAQRAGASQAIRAQLEHFKKGEWEQAVSYQSSNLKKNFSSTTGFRDMIVGSYPQFAKYKKIEFGKAQAAGPRVQMEIKLTGNDNIVVDAVYIMVQEKDGYKVEGVSGGAAPQLPDGVPA